MKCPQKLRRSRGSTDCTSRYVVNHHENVDNVYDYPLVTTYSKICTLICRTVFGALDRTHIQCRIGDDIGQRYRNRKGDKTWNVLMVVSFDGMITYVNAG